MDEQKRNESFVFRFLPVRILFNANRSSLQHDVESDAQSDGFFRSMRRDSVPGAGTTRRDFSDGVRGFECEEFFGFSFLWVSQFQGLFVRIGSGSQKVSWVRFLGILSF